MSSRRLAALVAAAGAALAATLLKRRADATTSIVADAVRSGGKFDARLTSYWPYSASVAELQMEGGKNDRKGKPLHTLERHLADKIAHPYVSVSGDDAIFPYGQRLSIDVFPGAVFRVVDTGGSFRGVKKVYRSFGREPLDVCVSSKKTYMPATATATIVNGDHFDKPGRAVAAGRFRGQDVQVGALEMLGSEARS